MEMCNLVLIDFSIFLCLCFFVRVLVCVTDALWVNCVPVPALEQRILFTQPFRMF